MGLGSRLFGHQTGGGKQDDGNELCDDRQRVPERLVVLCRGLTGGRGKEGLTCDEEGRDEQENVDAVRGTELVCGCVVATVWRRGQSGRGEWGEDMPGNSARAR